MTFVPHTPDPTAGAITDAANLIPVPDDFEPVRGAIGRIPAEAISDWVAFLTKGPLNDIDFKITGNGTPPAGGYTPTTRPIEIKGGEGLAMTAPLSVATLRSSLPMIAAQPAPTADPGANTLHSTNVEKAWALIETDGVGGYTIRDGFNIDNCVVAATHVFVNWKRPFANGDYAATVTTVGAGLYSASIGTQTTAGAAVYTCEVSPSPGLINPATTAFQFAIRVSGRH